jgi:transposase-like protein
MAKYHKARSRASRRRSRKHVYSLAESLAREGIREKLQDALEAERDEMAGRDSYERLSGSEGVVYRNGYHKKRCLVCGCGSVEVRVPRLEVPYESKIVPRYDRLTPEMKTLLPELYLHGLSTGDFDPALGWLLGERAPLSPTTIVRLKRTWEQEYESWKHRRLDKEYLYVWADGIYPKGGPIDESLCLLVVLGVTRTGSKELLALAEGYRESEESWKGLFRDLKERGVQWLGLVVGDGIKGLWKAVRDDVFPRARHQRCWVHKIRNVLDKVPDKAHDEILAALREIYHAKSHEEARRLTQAFVARYRSLYPRAVDCLQDACDQLFTYFLFPRYHWKSIKTTNPIESLFSAVKLRTKAARRLRTRLSAVCLVFQVLKQSERCFRKINGYTVVSTTIDVMKVQTKTQKVRTAA